ncbi:hypothetical protein SKAU_G00081020 [Synaphobranchus kaupii]|uniref:Uncharacterized protein n=1 Tax=Synaphobranchus kaupii TaxID=118154 RepID=A0A9Q1J569_SYNKA|nr:hypothetical protein SKAU_G00081020 [Synaphobranchus kaupii]
MPLPHVHLSDASTPNGGPPLRQSADSAGAWVCALALGTEPVLLSCPVRLRVGYVAFWRYIKSTDIPSPPLSPISEAYASTKATVKAKETFVGRAPAREVVATVMDGAITRCQGWTRKYGEVPILSRAPVGRAEVNLRATADQNTCVESARRQEGLRPATHYILERSDQERYSAIKNK